MKDSYQRSNQTLTKPTTEFFQVPLCRKPIQYVHIDNSIIVVEKPEFLLSVPSRRPGNNDSVLSRVLIRFPDACLVHRLDLDTSGLMLFARTPQALRHMNRLFQLRKVHKEYEAIVIGQVNEKAGVVELALAKDWPNKPLQKIDFIDGKPSQTYYENLGAWAPPQNDTNTATQIATRLRLYPRTGRTHQLRVHTRMIGHSIVGCDMYGTEEAYHLSERLLLHACKLVFEHPASGQVFSIERTAPF